MGLFKMISPTSMIIKHSLLILLLVFLLPLITAQTNPTCQTACPPQHSLRSLPYPFGFSSGCAIELNCTQAGSILIGDFPVHSINSDSIIVDVKSQCNRPFHRFIQLFGHRYAPTSRNSILLQNCSETVSPCIIPSAEVQTHFELENCSYSSDNLSCYYQKPTFDFIDLQKLTSKGCQFFMSSIAGVDLMTNSDISAATAVSLNVETLELGWWLEGACGCSPNANCTILKSPIDKKLGHRCRCKEGFTGDGYSNGTGCLEENPRHRRTKLIIGLTIAAVGALLMPICFCCKIKKTEFGKTLRLNQNIEVFIKNHGPLALARYKFAEVKKMTNSFEVKLGQGGYGEVYKGKLLDGHLVAVKLLKLSKGNGEEFINEVASISRTSHVNVVTLLGFCWEGDKRALIYEFMPNGSLDKFIHNKTDKAEESLTWENLYQIAIGTARGLEYLHRGCNTRILHFDIKPHNILLDENFCPKISDFGLAKLCMKKESIISISEARGTVGYLAPEIWNRNIGGVSHKSDVYSYGMMLLDMVGGRKNMNAEINSTSENYFPDWIYDKLEEGSNLGSDGANNMEENDVARRMTIVGLWCIQTFPTQRPTISRVIEMLEGSLNSLEMPPKPVMSSPPRLELESCYSTNTTA